VIGSRKSKGRRTIGVFRRVTRAIRSALPWGLGEPGPDSGASVSIRRHIIAGSTLVGALVLGLGGWAATAQISGALIAQGSIVIDSNVKKVQHPTGGVVGELLVQDGDHVKAGDILLRLDETVTRANLAIVTKGLTELYARKARLAAERDGADTMAAPPEVARHLDDPDVKDALASERKLFELRRQDRLGQKKQLQERITQLQEQITGLGAQQNAKDKGIGLVEQEAGRPRSIGRKISSSSIVSHHSSGKKHSFRANAANSSLRSRRQKEKSLKSNCKSFRWMRTFPATLPRSCAISTAKSANLSSAKSLRRISSSAPTFAPRKTASFFNRRRTPSVA